MIYLQCQARLARQVCSSKLAPTFNTHVIGVCGGPEHAISGGGGGGMGATTDNFPGLQNPEDRLVFVQCGMKGSN